MASFSHITPTMLTGANRLDGSGGIGPRNYGDDPYSSPYAIPWAEMTDDQKIFQILWVINAVMPYWKDRMNDFDTCRDMFHGTQWTPDEVNRFRATGREPFVFNRIKPQVLHLLGEQREGTQQWRLVPDSPQNEEKAAIAEKAMNAVAQSNKYEDVHEPAMFFDGVVGGIGWSGIRIDKIKSDKDELFIDRVDPHEIIFDTTCRVPDLSDARWLARRVFRSIPDAQRLWPDKQDIISRYINWNSNNWFDQTEWFDAGNVLNYDQYLVPIIEFYERRIIRVFQLLDPNDAENPIETFNTDEEAFNRCVEKNAQHIATGMPMEQMAVMTTEVPRIVQVTFVGLDILEEKQLEQDFYPYFPFFNFFDNGIFESFIDVSLFPQKFFNRVMSQAEYSLGVQAKGGVAVDLQALAEGMTLEQFRRERSKTGAVIAIKPGRSIKEAIQPLEEGRFSPQILDLAAGAKEQIDQAYPAVAYGTPVPGINQGQSDQSGLAIGLQQRAASTGTQVTFDNFKLYRQLLGEGLLYYLMHYLKEPMQMQLMGKMGTYEWVQMNTSPSDTLIDERFAVKVTDAQYSVTKTMMTNNQIQALFQQGPVMQLLGTIYPQSLPVLLRAFFETSNLTDSLKQDIIASFNQPPPMQGLPPGGPQGASGAPPLGHGAPPPASPGAGQGGQQPGQ